MSVRAYPIKKIVRGKNPSFNLWRDGFVMALISTSYLNDSSGFVELEKFTVEEALKDLKIKQKKGIKTFKDSHCGEIVDIETGIEVLTTILKDFKKGEEYQLYDCY
jgi:hypothetical protein